MQTANQIYAVEEDMKPATFARFRALIHERSGIALGDNKVALVKARIAKRMRTLQIEKYADYLHLVERDQKGRELWHLLDAISTNVTSFYREARHFEILRTWIKERLDQGHHQFRLWSTACSSGEEPFTMAIELREAAGNTCMDAKILATDLAASVLERCLQGEYAADRLSPVPKHLKAKYFTKMNRNDQEWYRVKQELRELLVIRQFNLSRFPYPVRPPIDVVFCRNVMIYFDRQLRQKMVTEFRRLLVPGGYLFIGHAESLAGMTEGFKNVAPSVYVRE